MENNTLILQLSYQNPLLSPPGCKHSANHPQEINIFSSIFFSCFFPKKQILKTEQMDHQTLTYTPNGRLGKGTACGSQGGQPRQAHAGVCEHTRVHLQISSQHIHRLATLSQQAMPRLSQEPKLQTLCPSSGQNSGTSLICPHLVLGTALHGAHRGPG